jgi:hypothetical protein
MSNDTTSILDLPTDPVGGGSIAGNVSFSANEKIGIPTPSSVSLDQTTINQIVTGLQQASTTGATQLTSRDIPTSSESISRDPQVQLNYIPPVNNADYISDYEKNEDIINNYAKGEKRGDSLDELYNELQVPILLAVLYFLFQLPVFKKNLYRFFPALFATDGNINLYGYIFTCILFGLIYYIISKTMGVFNKF